MATSQNRKKLQQAVAEIWGRGLVLTPDSLHYIDSTFLNPSLEELEAILCNDANCEKDSLLELIFFPDQSLQVRLEGLLERYDFGIEDEEKISRALTAKRLQTTLFFPPRRGRLTLAVPDWVVGHFIRHLNISKKTNPALIDAIRIHVPQPYQALLKVKLRNSRFKLTGNKISFLAIFFEKMAAEFKIMLSAYDFLLSFFEEIEDDTDLYCALTQKKRFYFQNLHKAQKFSAQLKSSNMETLFLQGIRAPYFDMDAARRHMDLIDRICYGVFGRSEFMETGDCIDLGEFSWKNEPEAMFKFLS